MASKVEIANLALSWLAVGPIISLDDDSNQAQLIKANYALTRDALLEEGYWTFATGRHVLAPLQEAPAYGYSHAFQVPSTTIAVRQVSSTPDFANNSNIDFRVEGDRILCDYELIYIKTTELCDDENQMTPKFRRLLAANLAMDLAIPLTESNTREQQLAARYQAALEEALASDGLQGSPETINSSDIIIRRFSNQG